MSISAGRPPNLSIQGIARFLKEIFPFKHIDEGSIKSLPSYDDRNYYFRGIQEHSQSTEEGITFNDTASPTAGSRKLGEYVLKINNPIHTTFDVAKGLNLILRHLHSQGLSYVQCTQFNRYGSDVFIAEGKDLLTYSDTQNTDAEALTGRFSVRVMIFIPGELLDNLEKTSLSSTLLLEVGNYIGQISTEMQKLSIPAIEARETQWNLLNFVDVSKHTGELDDPKQREIAEKVISNFKEHVVPKISTFKQGIIYGDANGLNIVVKKNGAGDEYGLAGIIDFGDCVHSCYIFDLGILLAYVMLENMTPISGESPIEFVVPLLRGYVQAFSFSREEISSLYYIVMARCCQSAVLGAVSFKAEPWNTYLLTTPTKCWKLLQLMLATPKEEVDQIWTEATY